MSLLAVLLSATVTASAQAGVPAPPKLPPATFAGVAGDDVFAAAPPEQAALLAQQQASGVRLIRQAFDWATVEPAPGVFDFSSTDGFVLAAARAGIQVLPILFGDPVWGSSRPAGSQLHGTYPPANRFAFAAYAAAVARRYGPGGTLWTENPGVVPQPIVDYQVWNEPNLTIYWLPKVSASGYTKLLQATSAAIKAVVPKAVIVTAGMPLSSHLGTKLVTYLDQMYTAGARGSFDAIGVNDYAATDTAALKNLVKVRAEADARKDKAAGLWVTEFGWADAGPNGGGGVGPTRQATLISATIKAMGKQRRALRLQGFVYYGWSDLPPYAGRTDFWGLHTGLFRLDGQPKPAAAAFRRAVLALG